MTVQTPPVLPPVTLAELSLLSRRAATVIERLRERVFAPGSEKRLELRFNVRTAAEMAGRTEKAIKQMTLRDAVLMGAAQAMALVPGVSRSGATLSMGRALGYDREAATRYAFLLAIPAVVGAGIFEIPEISSGDNQYGWGPTITATVVSFVCSEVMPTRYDRTPVRSRKRSHQSKRSSRNERFFRFRES
jgi:hypothetical protein